jgi:DNA polymerase-3 subunit delta'
MPFRDFIGNPAVLDRLRKKLQDGRFPHSVILCGPEGVGKRTCALMIARTLNCAGNLPNDFCGACSHCRKIEAGIHPDVRLIGLEDDAAEIKIAQIRQALEHLGLQPLEGRNKVFILDPANAMNNAAANALLKGLEEPPENSYFLLLTSNLQELLLTVRSRSQKYHFMPLPPEELRRFGGEELALRWSRGSIGLLKSLDVSALKARREIVLGFLETASRSGQEEFRDLIGSSADLARSKADFETHLGMIGTLLADLLYVREGLPERVVNVDIGERLARLAAGLSSDRLVQLGEFLGTMEKGLKGYWNRQLLTDNFAVIANSAVEKLADDNPAKSR